MERDGVGEWPADQYTAAPPFPTDNYHGFADEHHDFTGNDFPDYGYVKLYVVGIPRTATEQDLGEYFGVFGNLIEVVLLKDKRTGFQQECCFVKYATIEQAEGAIGALHGHPFAEGMNPLQVKYAVGERERLGSFGAHFHKLYVGCLSKQTMKWEIEDVFAPFGFLEAIYVPKDDFGHCRGCAFVQFSCREMAIAAIQALHGIYVMKGCEQPLVVRFADPKKPRMGDSRHAPHNGDPSGGHNMYNEMQQMKSSPPGWRAPITSSFDVAAPAAAHPANYVAENEYPIECEWSEHVAPDGDLYYYNCVTCESRWEKPKEYALYEQELDNEEQQESEPEALSSPDVLEVQGCSEAMKL